jgi:2,3-bisphosphoglycerate-independent phosphoglycerate mutase
MRPPLTLLIVLDGWGLRDAREGNAIAQARKPFFDRVRRDYPSSRVASSGEAVGLPKGQMGNSEVGHMTMGAGRVIDMDIVRITRAVQDGSLRRNEALLGAMHAARDGGGSLHFLGLVSDGGVHSHLDHLVALLEMAAAERCPRVFVHAFLDGRDTPPSSGAGYLRTVESRIEEIRRGAPSSVLRVASVMGRYYAMDRDTRWDRIEKAYRCLTQGDGRRASSAVEAAESAYALGETDEFVKPVTVGPPGADPAHDGRIGDGDSVIFFNFRADRARQITNALTDQRPALFAGKINRGIVPKLARFVCMTEYDKEFRLPIAFPPEKPERICGEIVSEAGLSQLRIAETEKYAHVTFFFNCGRETPFSGEDRVLIPSVREVATYDQKPEMSAEALSDELVRRIEGGRYAFILANYANPDMVGHTGVIPAAVKAVETIDACVDRVTSAAMAMGAVVLITGDHGNIELMRDEQTGEPHTAHTTNPVPLYALDPRRAGEGGVRKLADGGLADIAPTLLDILELPKPAEMTGRSLIVRG